MEEFPLPSPLLRFPAKLITASRRRSNGLIPPTEPSPSVLPSLLRRVGGMCSLGPLNLSGSPSVCPLKRSSPPSKSPLALTARQPLDQPATGPQGLFYTRPGVLPPKWAPACLAFLTNCYPHPVKNRDQTTDYFFVSGPPNSLRNPSHPSLSSDPA